MFVDLDKVYDRVPRDKMLSSLSASYVSEKYVIVVQDMYNECVTVVTSTAGITKGL